MQFKIDTKEKFHVITIKEPKIAANMTAILDERLLPFLEMPVKNVIVNLEDTQMLEIAAAEKLLAIQQTFYEQHASFVLCCLQPAVEEQLDREGILELINSTPTETEAWDIVQMEEIERELLGGEE